VPIEFYGSLDLNSNQINELADGLIASDAVNLGQVTQLLNNRDWKQSVRAGSGVNVTLATPGASVGGVTMNVGDRFLARGQTTGSENGLYVWNGAATPATRATDADANSEVTAGLVVAVTEGNDADTLWMLSTNDPITIGVTSLAFTRVGGAKFTQSVGDGSTQTFVINHNLGTRALHVTVYRDSGIFAEVAPDVRHTDANNTTIRFTPAPAVNEFVVVIS